MCYVDGILVMEWHSCNRSKTRKTTVNMWFSLVKLGPLIDTI